MFTPLQLMNPHLIPITALTSRPIPYAYCLPLSHLPPCLPCRLISNPRFLFKPLLGCVMKLTVALFLGDLRGMLGYLPVLTYGKQSCRIVSGGIPPVTSGKTFLNVYLGHRARIILTFIHSWIAMPLILVSTSTFLPQRSRSYPALALL